MTKKGIDLDQFERLKFKTIIDIIIKYYKLNWNNFKEDYKKYKKEEKRETRI